MNEMLLTVGLIVAAERGAADRAADRRRLPDLCRPQGLGRGPDAPRPQCGRPFGLVPVLCRPAQIRLQGSHHPRRRQQGRLRASRRWSPPPWRLPPGRSSRSPRAGRSPNINVGILYLFAISSLGVYGVIMGGWASNSKYPFLAALRSAAQMVSYEVSIGFVIITVLLCAGSLNLHGNRAEPADRARHHARPAQFLPRLVLAAAPADVRRLLRFGAGRDQPAALRSRRSRIANSWPASWWNIPPRPTCCSCSANTWPSPSCAP